jgi:hypothetical protein
MAIKLSRLLAILSLVLISGCYPTVQSLLTISILFTQITAAVLISAVNKPTLSRQRNKDYWDIFNDPDGDHKPSFLSASSAAVILDRINQNMTDAGWTRVIKIITLT